MTQRRNRLLSCGVCVLGAGMLLLTACGHSPRQEYYLIRGVVIEPTVDDPAEVDVHLPESRHATVEPGLDDF